MPNTTEVIFLKEKHGDFKLREDIKSFGLNPKRRQYYVKFKKGDNYLYYNPSNVDVAKFVRQLEPPMHIIRKTDGTVFSNILGVRVFKGWGHTAFRVIFDGGKIHTYTPEYISIEEHIDDQRSLDVWQYLNEVAQYNKIPIDEDKTISLADNYAKLSFVAKGSLLEAYLNKEVLGNQSSAPSAPIFPFGCNRSQYKAVKNALENKLSVIQGPPGTGKTQTILNILANLIVQGKTMQIVSNNNSAVENVKEKLEGCGLDFICAQLGRASNKQAFVETQSGTYPDMSSWELNEAKMVQQEAISLSEELQAAFESQEKLAKCTEKLAEFKRQIDQFPIKFEVKNNWSLSLLEKYFHIVSRDFERKQKLGWWTKFRLRYHRLPVSDDVIDKLHYLLIASKAKVLELECNKYKNLIKGADEKNDRLREISMLVLKDSLYRKYKNSEKRPFFEQNDIYLRTWEFLKEYPVVLSTTFSATTNINKNYKFDYLIMDEASQVDIAAGALALSCAKNAVIVGDLKQLPNVVDANTEEIVSTIFAKYSIAEAYRYSTNSFLSSLCTLYPNIPQTLLREHYRCDPLIIGFCSKQFYNGELIPMKKSESEFSPIHVVRTVRGNHARGTVNHRQVDTIINEVLPALEEQFTDIGIIAPYNDQVNAINDALRNSGRNYVAATVHKFQGRENEAIILSTVDNQIQDFTDDPHLLNVAVSRAKKQFTLVVSAEDQPDSNIKDLIDYIEYYQGKSAESEISSIYDLLYEDYTQDLLNFYKTHKRVSEYDSENLTYWAIDATIKDYGLEHLGILMHYPLRHLLTPASVLTPEQRTYASRSWTHVDFLVYDTVSHKAKIAIEVDGTQYHKKESDQGHRDSLKDSVLAAIGLPLLRLSTAGSQEKAKIAAALRGASGN